MLLRTKKSLISLLVTICAVLFAVVGAVSFVQSNQTAYANSTNTETIDFGTDGITDAAKVQELITVIDSTATSYDDLSTNLGSNVKNASNFKSAKTVTLGGVKFNIVYVSKADYAANGTEIGDIIVTLWMAENDWENPITSQYSYPDGRDNTYDAYPTHMYSSSYIRSTLVGSAYLKVAGEQTLSGTDGAVNDAWKPFNVGGAFYKYLATPANMAWQETLSAVYISGYRDNYPNEAWGTPSKGSFVFSPGAYNFDYSEKTGYSDWKNDRIWLPALTEVRSETLWNTTSTQRCNIAANWLRSGKDDYANMACYLYATDDIADGVTNSTLSVRPAIHLNLKTAKQNTDHVHVWESADNDGWVVTVPATCVSKGIEERKCTAANCPLTDSKETREIEIDTTAHTFDKLVIVSATDKYSAFDLFDTQTAEVYTHCSACNQNIEKLAASDLTVTYNNGNCLHTDDTHVSLSATVGGQTLISEDISVNVSKSEATLVWEYTTSTVSEENEWVWNEIVEGSYFTYDGTSKSYRVRVRFTGADNDPDKDKHYYRAVDGILLVDGGDKAIENAATYALSLDEGKFADYLFTNNSASIEVKPYEITLSDAEVYRWTLGADKGSLLRDAYIEESNGTVLYYDPETGEAEGRTKVTRSVVRYRGDDTGLNIVLNGGEIADLFAGTGKRTSVEYSGTTAVGAVGKYTAVATLTLNDTSNYKYVGEITVADSRGMTIVISENGMKAVITKEWYVATINNGLLMPDGGEYSVNGWTFGDDATTAVPMLEHGDENFDLNNILQDDKRISFGLFTDVDMTNQIGETFYRYNIAEYINKSMPSGNYVLKVSVAEVTDLYGLAYQAFTRTFTFTVQKGTLEVNDTLNGETFEHVYNGNVQLFDNEYNPTVSLKYVSASDRLGIWKNSEYDKFYGAANITFHLARWQAEGGVGYEFVSLTQLENTLDRKQAPREVDTYTVQYKISALNYADYGGSSSFTVIITKQTVTLPQNVTETLIKEYVYQVPQNALYYIEGNAKFTQAGTHTVTLKLADADNYAWQAGDNVEGNTATVTVTLTMHEHVYGEWTVDKAATCTETGTRSKICTLCDDEVQEEIAALGHDLTQHEAKAATCTEKGWNAYETCSRCDHTTYEEIAALGHDLAQHEAKAATCTEKGWNAYETCSRCDHTTCVEIAASGHNLTHVEYKEATTDAAGNIEYWICADCGEYFSDEGGDKIITDKSSVEIPMLTPEIPSTPSEPQEKKSYVWICAIIIPLVVIAGGLALGIWLFKKRKN